MSRREIIWTATLVGSVAICLIAWLIALQAISRLDYRADSASGFVALRLAPEAGVSYQWSSTGTSIWLWRPGENWRVWPPQ